MAYNFTNITMANSTLQLLDSVNNDLIGGHFWILVLVAIAMVILINLTFYKVKAAFLGMGFSVAVIGGLFWLGGLVPLYVAIICIVQLVVFILIHFFVGGD